MELIVWLINFMKLKNKFAISISLGLFLILSLVLVARAATNDPLTKSNDDLSTQVLNQLQAGSGETATVAAAPLSVTQLIIDIIQLALSIVGIIFILMVVLGGYDYFMARGDEEKVKKGVAHIEQAVLGLLIIILSYGITFFVGNKVNDAVHSPNFQGGTSAGGYALEAQTSDIRDVIHNIKNWDWSK